MNLRRLLLFAALIVPALPLRAAEPLKPDEKINSLLAPVRDKHRLPGLVAAVVQDGKVVACGAVGTRKLGTDVPITVNDKIHLGSCTKAVTAAMIATLIEEKKLSWDTTLAEAFPSQKVAIHPDLRDVTLEQLLTHTSGLRANVDYDPKAPGTSPGPVQRQYLFRKVLRDPPEYKPGTGVETGKKGLYSNLGYIVAGMMAEAVTRKSWEDLVRERVYKPLNLTTAGFGPPGTKGRVDQPWGHYVTKGGKTEPTQVDNPLLMSPATGSHMSMADWARFVTFAMRAPKGEEKLLKKETFERLVKPPEGSNYAGGWFLVVQPWMKGIGLNHMGSNGSWYTVVWAAPSRDLGFLAVTNLHGDAARDGTNDTIAALAEYWLKKIGD